MAHIWQVTPSSRIGGRLMLIVLLKAKPPKGGDAKLRGDSDRQITKPAGPPANPELESRRNWRPALLPLGDFGGSLKGIITDIRS